MLSRRVALRGLLVLPTLLGLAASLGCARNPVSGLPNLVLVSTEREIEIGAEEAAKVEKTIGYVPDRPLQLWVQQVGQRLAEHSPRQNLAYHFYAVDMQEPNAFALPGGHVYVSRGLLALLNSEDELACVLGHEIGHVAARHSVQRVTLTTPFALVLGLPTAIVGAVSRTLGALLGGVSSAATGVVIAPYSRSQERDADRIGLELAAAAGWDPTAMSGFLETLQRSESLARGGQEAKRGFFASHPSTPSRMQDTAEYAASLEVAPRDALTEDRDALLDRLAGLLVGENPGKGTFDGGLFLHPRLGFALRFPDGWETANAESYVAAADPDAPEVLAVLQVSTEGDDPMEGARADGLGDRDLAKLERSAVGGLDATRFEGERRGTRFVMTWIAHRGLIYRVLVSAPKAEFESRRRLLEKVAVTFRPLRESDQERIRQHRLVVVRARLGEDLAALVERVGGTWSVEQTAVANGLDASALLAPGQRVKLPVAFPYPIS